MDKDQIISQKEIENRIFTIRGVQVMLDSDLAKMYEVPTGRLNEQVKRNSERFPGDFMFQLTRKEWENLKSQNAISNQHGGRRKLPYVFTEQGVSGLSGVLRSPIAAKIHVSIMRAFVRMRKLINEHLGFLQRLERVELQQLNADKKFEKVFKALESKNVIPTQGVFFNGQVFDAYEWISKLIRSAQKEIILIDNYIDESVLTHFSKKKEGVRVLLLTKRISNQLSLDVKKANEQYGGFSASVFAESHDRFLILDKKEIYHIGASLKDLGKKWFAFSRMDGESVRGILEAITKVEKE